IALAIVIAIIKLTMDVGLLANAMLSASMTLLQIAIILNFIKLWVITFKRLNDEKEAYDKFLQEQQWKIRNRIRDLYQIDGEEIDMSQYMIKVDHRKIKKEKLTHSCLFGTVILVNAVNIINSFIFF